MSEEFDKKLQKIVQQLKTEETLLAKAKQILSKSTSHDSIANIEQEIQLCERNILYLKTGKEKLEKRHLSRSNSDSTSVAVNDLNVVKLSLNEENFKDSAAGKPKQTALDLRKADSNLSRELIAYRFQEIEYKLNVEKNLKDGYSRLHSVYVKDPNVGDNGPQVRSHLADSTEKCRIYERALRKYRGINIGIFEDDSEEEEIEMAWMKPGLRRPMTGVLTLKVVSGRYLETLKDSESYVVIKVDGKVKEQTKPSKVDRWQEEFVLNLEKANELEISIYNLRKDRPAEPVGLFWMPISELTDDQRKKNAGNSGWAPADGSGKVQSSIATSTNDVTNPGSQSIESVEAWWKVEPAGEFLMRLKFVKQAGKKRNMSRLGRQGAVRKPKEITAELRGHKFVARQFYQVMTCAYCDKFLVNSTGYQCQDCRYFCHESCASKVVLKCIAKPNYELDTEEQKMDLRHRIPHRFESATNLMAKWCCHCGYMIPLGRGKGKSCAECNIFCHNACQHLVPNFCGMNMAMANQMLEMEKAKSQRAKAKTFPGPATNDAKLEKNNFNKKAESSKSTKPSKSFTDIEKASKTAAPSKAQSSRVTIDDFALLAVLGRGNFGKVMLAEELSTKKHYAIKVLKKKFIIQSDEIEGTKSEKRVFLAANRARHPFLVGLHSCFQSEASIYFVMEYISGGDLMWHIQRQRFTEPRAKFYAIEVLLALEYFHQNNIVYRDLKLDNILLAADGHIKIADYGLCKERMPYGSTTTTFCGTPEFMAPEIILEQPYGRAVDWWAFGVLLYEMILGQSPFHGDDEDEIFDAILEDDILYPYNLARESVSILQKLLIRDPNRRLGGGVEDAKEVKRHPYFDKVVWDDYLYKRVPPPHLPVITSATDTSNFDEEFTKEQPIITPTNSVLSNADQQEFRDFSYVADWVGQ